MEKEQLEKLKAAFQAIVKEPPFNGTVTHRTRPMFLAKWKEYIKVNGIVGYAYVDDLIKLLNKR